MIVNGHTIGPKADLKMTNLEGASLVEADLEGADLRMADLEGADLRMANLRGANLAGAFLEGANLEGANLEGATLRAANLEGANLEGATLRGVDLYGANLRGAYLRVVDLYGATLRGAYLEGAKLPHFQICPQEGSFIAYKKTTKGVVRLMIPEDAKRTSSLVGRKCRASKVVVLDGDGVGGTGTHYHSLVYGEGETLLCEDYDDDIRVESTKGIHFFMTKEEAEEWN